MVGLGDGTLLPGRMAVVEPVVVAAGPGTGAGRASLTNGGISSGGGCWGGITAVSDGLLPGPVSDGRLPSLVDEGRWLCGGATRAGSLVEEIWPFRAAWCGAGDDVAMEEWVGERWRSPLTGEEDDELADQRETKSKQYIRHVLQ